MRDPLVLPTLTRRAVVFDASTGALLALYSIGAVTDIGAQASDVLAPLCVAIALACRRVAPTVAAVAVAAFIAVVLITARMDYVAGLALFPVVHAGAAHPRPSVRRATLAAIVAVSIIAGLALPTIDHPDQLTDAAGAGATLLFGGLTAAYLLIAWAFGTAAHQRQRAEQAQVDSRMAELERRRVLELFDQESERNRIARDMHDVVAHALAVVVAQAEGARYTFETSPQSARNALDVIATTARTSLADVRTMLEQLRHSNVDAAFDDHNEQQNRLLERMRAAGMTIELTEIGEPASSATMTELTAHRLLTEALTNALKYADLTADVQVRIDRSVGIALDVRNRVAATDGDLGGTGHGLIGVAERARLAGGTAASHADGRGNWIFTAEIPHHAGSEIRS